MTAHKGKKIKSEEITIPHPVYILRREEGWNLIIGSAIAHDSALITLSSAFLGLIFISIKPSIATMTLPFLMLILAFLFVTLFSAILSFWLDQLYGNSLINYAYEYYCNKKDEYETKKHWSYYASIIFKIIADSLFFISLILFLIFNITNFKNESAANGINTHNTSQISRGVSPLTTTSLVIIIN